MKRAGPERPPSTTPNIRLENIPAELKALPQWVTWQYERKGEKWTKVPYDAKTGHRASTTNPQTWSTFDAALRLAQEQGLDGVGFVFTKEDPYCGIDLDDCLDDDGRPVPEAQEIIDSLDSYTEVSPSRRGVKIWVRGALPEGRGRRSRDVEGFGGIEFYQHSRYFTVTGWSLG